jgi:hypothetical protein
VCFARLDASLSRAMVKSCLIVLGKLTPLGRMQKGLLGAGAGCEKSLRLLVLGVVLLACLIVGRRSESFQSVVLSFEGGNCFDG